MPDLATKFCFRPLLRFGLRTIRTCLRIIHLPSSKSYLFIICPISHGNLTKSEIRSSLFAPLRVHILIPFDIQFWSRFHLIYLYFPIYSFIYLYLPTFSLICPYLVILTPNCPNLTIYAIFTLHTCIYSSSKTAPVCAKF